MTEIENWINDKMALASSTDYGKDENAADKLLAKNKVGLKLIIGSYSLILSWKGKWFYHKGKTISKKYANFI